MSTRHLLAVLAICLLSACLANAAAPRVVSTSPDNGEIEVSADLKAIRIEFDGAMNPDSRSIVGGGVNFPEITGTPRWIDAKTITVPVTLKPDHPYQFSINSDTFKGFCGINGEPAEAYPISFRTRAAGAKPALPDVTPEQNKLALAALAKAIDEDFAHRDLRKIDWKQEIENRRAQFENAPTANAFARLAAHLLRLAQDGHVSVQAGDVRIWTSANSAPPNFNILTLRRMVPGWKEKVDGVITGRFDDPTANISVGYIHFAQCSPQQADSFDAALAELKDTKALIIDARYTGGGNEFAAQRIAGRFVEQPRVYSRDRIREAGHWSDPFDRIIQPRKDAARYAGPVAVLIGPKVVSSAESFVLMMQQGDNAKLIGDVTGGSSGRPMPHKLGNGVTVYLSSWEDKTPGGDPIEGHGVQPDIVIKASSRDLEKSDVVLEAALKYLRQNMTTTTAPVLK